MSKSRALLLAAVAFVLGLVVAGGIAALILKHLSERLVAYSSAAEITWCVGTLDRIRSGDTNRAINLLELKLDGGIVGVGMALESISPSQRDTTLVKTLQAADKYRTKYPRKTEDPEIDAIVARSLGLVADPK